MSFSKLFKELKEKEERRKQQILESLPPSIKNLNIMPLRYQKTKDHFKPFVAFCQHLISQYPDFSYVFIERDANPLYLTTFIINQESNLNLDLRTIGFTRDMLPKKLNEKLFNQRNYETRNKLIAGHLSRNRRSKTYLHQYLLQELGCLDRMLFIDTGFYGTITTYLENFFVKKETNQFLFTGPQGSNCFVPDTSGENTANFVENQIKHPYQILGLEKTEKIVLQRNPYLQYPKDYQQHIQETYLSDYSAILVNALEQFHETSLLEQKIQEYLPALFNLFPSS